MEISRSGRLPRVLALVLLLLLPLPNRARSSTVRIPFGTVQAMILIDGKVNGNPATFLLDTGANRTIVSVRVYGNAQFDWRRLPHNSKGPGLTGGSLRLPADLILAQRIWAGQRVSVMDLDDLRQMLHMDFDGLLGQDLLREFRSVRIDYHDHVLELQE
jgi:gag-polyprotein putative aspartyl protease